MAYFLEILTDNRTVATREIPPGTLLVGSGSEVDIVLHGPGVEARHCRMEVSEDAILVFNLSPSSAAVRVGGRTVRSTLLEAHETVEIADYTLRFSPIATATAEVDTFRRQVFRKLIERMNLRELDIDSLAEADLWERCGVALDEILKGVRLPRGVALDDLRRQVLQDALGLGPIQDLLEDESVTEIMVNGPDAIFAEREGRIQRTSRTFTGVEHVITTIQRIVWPVGRRVDESTPMVDARLPDGSRVNAIIPPVALQGPMLTIRKFSRGKLGLADLIDMQSLSAPMAALLRFAVVQRRNIVISGGASTGKTTLLNAIAAFIPKHERVVTIEDSAELVLSLENLCSLETRPPNMEGVGEISMRDLVRNALRMRPDRVIIGECRGGEALDMLQAMNSGNDGSLTTLHASSAEDALLRLETLVMMAALDLPSSAVRRQIASGIHLVVQTTRLSDGTRRVEGIAEVGRDASSGEFAPRPIFWLVRDGVGGGGEVRAHYEHAAERPRFVREAMRSGIAVPTELVWVFEDATEKGS